MRELAGVPRVPFLKNSLNLAIMCTTNRTLDSFDGYGCWCKQKGHVGEPVDDIDNCCKYHETSVQKLLQTAYCNSFDSFVFPYSAFCAKTKDGNKPTCLRDFGNACARYLCVFDAWLATCLEKYISILPPGYKAPCPHKLKDEW
ncbi:hypothetical protein D918_01608 [Trichuris suis]|nr:hypothetical protein D918_01608 [Trichuris suis]